MGQAGWCLKSTHQHPPALSRNIFLILYRTAWPYHIQSIQCRSYENAEWAKKEKRIIMITSKKTVLHCVYRPRYSGGKILVDISSILGSWLLTLNCNIFQNLVLKCMYVFVLLCCIKNWQKKWSNYILTAYPHMLLLEFLST